MTDRGEDYDKELGAALLGKLARVGHPLRGEIMEAIERRSVQPAGARAFFRDFAFALSLMLAGVFIGNFMKGYKAGLERDRLEAASAYLLDYAAAERR